MGVLAGPGWRLKIMMLALVLVALLCGGGWLWTPDKERAELEARYAGAGSEFVSVDGLRMHVRDSAPGAPAGTPTLILLHGFGSSLHTWEPWAQALAPQWRVIRLDLPGAGLTGADPSDDYSDERAVQLIAALMDQRGVARASFIGHSMGGRIAWRFAVEQPALVDKLVLEAPDGFASPGFEYGKPPEVGLAVRAMRYALPRAVLRMGLEPAYANPKLLDEDTVTRYHDMMLAPGVRAALISRMQRMVLQDPAPLLQRLHAPTLLLWGAQDQMIPPANAQDYLRTLPQARLVTVPGVGHVPHEEAPAAALPAVQAFLQD
jgi:pimeloyl-ACP methyl ester carboxylesterase